MAAALSEQYAEEAAAEEWYLRQHGFGYYAAEEDECINEGFYDVEDDEEGCEDQEEEEEEDIGENENDVGAEEEEEVEEEERFASPPLQINEDYDEEAASKSETPAAAKEIPRVSSLHRGGRRFKARRQQLGLKRGKLSSLSTAVAAAASEQQPETVKSSKRSQNGKRNVLRRSRAPISMWRMMNEILASQLMLARRVDYMRGSHWYFGRRLRGKLVFLIKFIFMHCISYRI